MRWLYDWDMHVFRAIHIDMHRDWLTPFFWLLSYSGLGQVQAFVITLILFWRRHKSKNFLLVIAGIGLSIATAPIDLMQLDPTVNTVLVVIRIIGIALMIAGAIRELRDRENPLRYYALPLLMTLLMAGLPVAQGVKHLIARDRPSNLLIAIPEEALYARSFPSGHSTSSFALAFMLWLLTRKKEHAWIGHSALVWAALVGLSRIYRGVHWPTDVIAGVFAGMFSAAFVYLVLAIFGHWTHVEEADEIAAEEIPASG